MWDLRLSQYLLWRMLSFAVWHLVVCRNLSIFHENLVPLSSGKEVAHMLCGCLWNIEFLENCMVSAQRTVFLIIFASFSLSLQVLDKEWARRVESAVLCRVWKSRLLGTVQAKCYIYRVWKDLISTDNKWGNEEQETSWGLSSLLCYYIN